MEASQWFVIDIGDVDMLMCKCENEDQNCFSYCFNATIGEWAYINCNLPGWIVETVDINFGYKTYTDKERIDALEEAAQKKDNKDRIVVIDVNNNDTVRSAIDKSLLNKKE